MDGAHRFGLAVRAYRLGYGMHDKHQCYLSVSENLDGSFHLTLVPLNQKVPSTLHKESYQWWTDDPAGKFTDSIASLRNVKRVKKIISFDVDETGNLL